MPQDLLAAFELLASWDVLLFLVAGVTLGVIFGALPGLTATMGVAVLTPLTFWLSPQAGMAMLLGIYCGAIPAGGIPAILLNIPGTPASIATTWDGYPLARQGHAATALSMNALYSWLGQVLSIMFLAFAAFPIASFGLRFGPPEYFALALFGLSLMAGVAGSNLVKGLLSGCLGLAIATVGLDPMTAYPRFTFGVSELLDGVAFVPAMIGLFGFGEVLFQITNRLQARTGPLQLGGKLLPRLKDLKQATPSGLLGAFIGTFVGAIPAAGGDIASVIAWEQARRISRKKENFGKGSLEGLAASCSACNAAIGGAMTTMLTLGIPGDAVSAVLIGALMIHGLQPGPLLFQDHRPFVFSLILMMLLASLVVAVVVLLAARPLAHTLRLPDSWLWAAILLLGVVGSFALSNSVADVWVMFVMGLVGFVFRWTDIPSGPLILGMILGPMMEANLRRALVLSHGEWLPILSRPIVLGFLIATAMSWLWPVFTYLRRRRPVPDDHPAN